MMELLEVSRFMLIGIVEALTTPGLLLASGQTPLWAAASIMAAATVLWLLSGFANDMLSARLHSHSENTGIRSWTLVGVCAASDMLHLGVGLYMWLATAVVMVWSTATVAGIFV